MVDLGFLEQIPLLSSSIDPLFDIVTSLVRALRNGLVDKESNQIVNNFSLIHDKLEAISERNRQTLRQIRIDKINETFGKYEEYIKHQYSAFNTMVDRVKGDPENASRYMGDFEKVYKNNKSDSSLDVFYRGVMGTGSLFERPLLEVYLEHCDRNRRVIEARCSHLAHLFHIGLIALIGYSSITEDDEDQVKEKWAKMIIDIQTKMQEILDQCEEEN
ncbi:protein rapunzel-like [Salminus brasiliensis]|uniref:protein rapunzel-like n=1 Tax=Salminus brasiliensis TaxID=930266 RepID=UPI003B83A3F3